MALGYCSVTTHGMPSTRAERIMNCVARTTDGNSWIRGRNSSCGNTRVMVSVAAQLCMQCIA